MSTYNLFSYYFVIKFHKIGIGYKDKMKIGIFDSGFGGSSVLKNIIKKTNFSNFVYYADRKNAPYGLKEKIDIYELTKKGVSFLVEHGASAVIIACNTATAASCPQIERQYDVPIIGIHPPIFDAIESYNDNNHCGEIPNILVYATAATLGGEHVIQNKHRIEDSHRANIELLSCSNIVPFIEEKKTHTKEFFDVLKKTFEPYKDTKIDALLFSCTHLPLIDKQIYTTLGYTPEIVLDGSEYIISKLKEYESYILRESGELSSSALASTFSDKIDNVKIMLHDTKEGSAAFDIFAEYLNIKRQNIVEI